MNSPFDVQPDLLAELVSVIQRHLYLERDPKNVFVWNPSKDVDCQAFVEVVDEVMGRAGLHPGFVEFKKPFVHRPEDGLEYAEDVEESRMAGYRPHGHPDLTIDSGRLIGYISPSTTLADIEFLPTISRLKLLNRKDVEDLRGLCDDLLETMGDD